MRLSIKNVFSKEYNNLNLRALIMSFFIKTGQHFFYLNNYVTGISPICLGN